MSQPAAVTRSEARIELTHQSDATSSASYLPIK